MTGAARLRETAAAMAIAAALLIAGCGGDDEPTASVAATATTTTPAASTTGSEKSPGKTSTTGKSTGQKQGTSKSSTTTTGEKSSGTATTSKAAPSKKKAAPVRTVPIPATRAKVGKAQTFSGDGDKTLGTITLKRSSVVRWTASGGSFALVDGAKKLSISGNAKSGQTFIAAGTYTSVKVTAKGHWTLSIAPLGN